MQIRVSAGLALVAALGLGGCASIITGTSQEIAIATTPGGARCVLTRENDTIATLESTPGKVTVRKDKHDILVTCDKAGYQTATKYLHSDVEAGTFGNIIAGGLIGWGIDSATGADNKYDEAVSIPMVTGAATTSAPVGSAPAENAPGS
jgi:hypothetical protein